MQSISSKTLSFSRVDSAKFFRTLNKRVNSYFKENNIKRTGNWKLWIKAVVMFTLLIAPYFILINNVGLSWWLQLLLSITMGVGMAGVGMNVMHDGNHGSYSSKKWVNKFMGGSIYVLAGNVYNWQVQHNVLHHTYTNIQDHDEDLDAGRVLRFSKHSEWQPHHKFQHIYSIFLYGLLTINWAITTDWQQMHRYMKRNLAYGKKPNPITNWTTLVISKIIYFSIWIVIPMLVLPWWKVLISFFVMHYTAGLILSVVFQLAHVIEGAEIMEAEPSGTMKNSWAVHQLRTTVNFATNNKIVNWFTGGLNHQVEHHIFPNISHIHYSKLSKIVKETAKEFNLPYNEYKTMRKAITAHFKHLKEMGTKPALQV